MRGRTTVNRGSGDLMCALVVLQSLFPQDRTV